MLKIPNNSMLRELLSCYATGKKWTVTPPCNLTKILERVQSCYWKEFLVSNGRPYAVKSSDYGSCSFAGPAVTVSKMHPTKMSSVHV